jgi:glycosyltransferase involved in cell wall biosynthesis
LGLRSAWKRIAISDFTRQQVARQFPALPVTVCDLALDPRYTNLKLHEQVPAITLTNVSCIECPLGEHVILHVGRMASDEQYKGQDVLVAGMAQIQAHYPDVQLVLVGRGDDAARLKRLALARSPAVQDAVFMPGFVPDDLLNQLYQRTYVFAMPSRGEGFGLVYLEAMRWGCPCIGSGTDASQCVIQHGETGLFANDPGDPDEVSRLILGLLGAPRTARTMGQAGFERLTTHFLYPHFKTRFLQAIAP